MRLITHNLLKCNKRGLKENEGYPLIIRAETTEVIPMDYNDELVKNLLRKINYHSLQSALKDLQLKESLIQFIEERKQVVKSDPTPESDNNTIKQQRGEEALVNDLLQSEELLKEMHHILFEYHIVNGVLICPTTGREFIVKDGIPNMLLHEDEV